MLDLPVQTGMGQGGGEDALIVTIKHLARHTVTWRKVSPPN
jgi:hypothetical protein